VVRSVCDVAEGLSESASVGEEFEQRLECLTVVKDVLEILCTVREAEPKLAPMALINRTCEQKVEDCLVDVFACQTK
jgi:hypothetical protein